MQNIVCGTAAHCPTMGYQRCCSRQKQPQLGINLRLLSARNGRREIPRASTRYRKCETRVINISAVKSHAATVRLCLKVDISQNSVNYDGPWIFVCTALLYIYNFTTLTAFESFVVMSCVKMFDQCLGLSPIVLQGSSNNGGDLSN